MNTIENHYTDCNPTLDIDTIGFSGACTHPRTMIYHLDGTMLKIFRDLIKKLF